MMWSLGGVQKQTRCPTITRTLLRTFWGCTTLPTHRQKSGYYTKLLQSTPIRQLSLLCNRYILGDMFVRRLPDKNWTCHAVGTGGEERREAEKESEEQKDEGKRGEERRQMDCKACSTRTTDFEKLAIFSFSDLLWFAFALFRKCDRTTDYGIYTARGIAGRSLLTVIEGICALRKDGV
eukprot:768491-Hanusia_phi.AAC.2